MSRAIPAFAAAVIVACAVAFTTACAPSAPSPPPASTSRPQSAAPVTPPPELVAPAATAFDKSAFSIDDPASLWVVVNKLRPLNPKDFQAADLVDVPVPHVYAPRLRKEAADAVVQMFAAFTAETGLTVQAQSAYRSFASQTEVYNGWVAQKGQAGADLTSARPGHSEHQTGLAIDISALPARCALDACFGATPQGQWLAANAWKHGFLLRYPEGKTHVTGYEYEPWHYRYIGVALSTELHTAGIATLEEFFALPAAPTY